jgi:hypothetical protein
VIANKSVHIGITRRVRGECRNICTRIGIKANKVFEIRSSPAMSYVFRGEEDPLAG